jgi:hypothetical protein
LIRSEEGLVVEGVPVERIPLEDSAPEEDVLETFEEYTPESGLAMQSPMMIV